MQTTGNESRQIHKSQTHIISDEKQLRKKQVIKNKIQTNRTCKYLPRDSELKNQPDESDNNEVIKSKNFKTYPAVESKCQKRNKRNLMKRESHEESEQKEINRSKLLKRDLRDGSEERERNKYEIQQFKTQENKDVDERVKEVTTLQYKNDELLKVTNTLENKKDVDKTVKEVTNSQKKNADQIILKKPIPDLLFYKKFGRNTMGKLEIKKEDKQKDIQETNKSITEAKKIDKRRNSETKVKVAKLTFSDFSFIDEDSEGERKKKKLNRPKPKPINKINKLPRQKLPEGCLAQKMKALERWRQMGRRRNENELKHRKRREEKLKLGWSA